MIHNLSHVNSTHSFLKLAMNTGLFFRAGLFLLPTATKGPSSLSKHIANSSFNQKSKAPSVGKAKFFQASIVLFSSIKAITK